MTETPQSRNALIADPGGVRGIHELIAMARVEKKTGKPIHELYNLHAGSSTGIIALSLLLLEDPANPGKPKFTAEQAAQRFEECARLVFPKPTIAGTIRQLFSDKAKYPAQGFEKELENIFGDTRVNQLLGNPMFFVSDARSGETICIHHIKDENGKLFNEYHSNMRVRDVIRGGTTISILHQLRWDYPVNPDDPHSKRIGMEDGGNVAGSIPHEADMVLAAISPPGARRYLSHFRTAGIVKTQRETKKKKPLIGGLIAYFLYGDKREKYLSWSFNAPINRTAAVLERLRPAEYFPFLAPINRKLFPEHPTISVDDANPDNMRRHRVRMNERLDEMEADGSLQRHCSDLMQKFRKPEPVVAPAPEKSGVRWSGPEVLRGFGASLVRAWDKAGKSLKHVVNDNLTAIQKPPGPKPPRNGQGS